MNDDNLVQFELPEPSSTPAAAAPRDSTQHVYTRLEHIYALVRDLMRVLEHVDVRADELALVDQVTTQLEQVLRQGDSD